MPKRVSGSKRHTLLVPWNLPVNTEIDSEINRANQVNRANCFHYRICREPLMSVYIPQKSLPPPNCGSYQTALSRQIVQTKTFMTRQGHVRAHIRTLSALNSCTAELISPFKNFAGSQLDLPAQSYQWSLVVTSKAALPNKCLQNSEKEY